VPKNKPDTFCNTFCIIKSAKQPGANSTGHGGTTNKLDSSPWIIPKALKEVVSVELDDLLGKIFDDENCATIGSFDFDEEFFTRLEDYQVVKIAESYVVGCNMSEVDFDSMPIAFCGTVSDVEKFMEAQLTEYAQIEGAELRVAGDIAALLAELSNQLAPICDALDLAFAECFEDQPEVLLDNRKLLFPSTIIKKIVNGTALRPAKPMGFVVDHDDKVYIQDGLIWFSPIGGLEKYFSNELGLALSCLGVQWDRQRFVADAGIGSQQEHTAESFLSQFNESRRFLEKRRAQMTIGKLKI